MSETQQDALQAEILDLNNQLLDSIEDGDWERYVALCDPRLTAFEPESRGQLVEGMRFHRFYFKLGGGERKHNTTMCAPKVMMLGDDVAVVTYVRLTQFLESEGMPLTSRFEETRVWQRQTKADGQPTWRHVHFHRSAAE